MKRHLLYIALLSLITPSLCQAQNPTLWGMTCLDSQDDGELFHTSNSGYSLTSDDIDYFFGSGINGEHPYGSLIQATNGLIYGLTEQGGMYGGGTIFNYDITTGAETILYNFGSSNSTGSNPYGSLLQTDNGLLYGMTYDGGMYGTNGNDGTLFSYDISTGLETILHSFGNDTDGINPMGSLIEANNGLLYGMTSSGGSYGKGTIFSYDTSTGTETVLHSFKDSDGASPAYNSLIQVGNLLYGMTAQGGVNGYGVVFSYDISNGTETVLHSFGGYNGFEDGSFPEGSLIQANNGLLYGMTRLGGYYEDGIMFSYNLSNSNYADISDFGGGGNYVYYPYGSLIQASNGLLYGMTYGLTVDYGELFSFNISTDTINNIIAFPYGGSPYGGLIEIDTPAVTSGINKISTVNNQPSIYPNPTSGQFTIKSNDNQNSYTIEIYNLMGEKIYESSLNNSQNTINLNTQLAGLYFIYLKSKESIEVAKLIIVK